MGVPTQDLSKTEVKPNSNRLERLMKTIASLEKPSESETERTFYKTPKLTAEADFELTSIAPNQAYYAITSAEINFLERILQKKAHQSVPGSRIDRLKSEFLAGGLVSS